tara:strand:- start:786 stop:1055 length:270 start_codon:yes stop_codon:yes gene_type:complete
MSDFYKAKSYIVKKGTVGYGSVMGHYNFFYPDEERECIFVSDCVAVKFRWMGYKNFVSVVVPKGSVEGEILEYKGSEVLWVKLEDIEAY